MTWQLQVGGRTLWQEARGEPLIGQQAVAHVLWNRARDGRWGNSLASACLWRYQFSGWGPHDPNYIISCGLMDDDTDLLQMINVVSAAMNSPDPTCGALFYYANSIAAPDWSKTMIPCGQFGSQLFFRDK